MYRLGDKRTDCEIAEREKAIMQAMNLVLNTKFIIDTESEAKEESHDIRKDDIE